MNEIKKFFFNLRQGRKSVHYWLLGRLTPLIRCDTNHALMGKKCKFHYLGVVEIANGDSVYSEKKKSGVRRHWPHNQLGQAA